MELNDLYEAGSDIMNAVTDAVNRNDYSHLSEDIRKTVEDIRVTIQRDKSFGDVRRRGYGKNYYRSYGTAGHNSSAGSGYRTQQVQQAPRYARKTPFLQKKVSRQSGVGKIILGVMGLVIGVPVLLFGGISALASLSLADLLYALIVGGGITGASLWGIISGDKQRKLVNQYYQYGKAAGEAEYVELSKLAAKVGKKTEDVREDIKKMMDKGLLPLAWLDEQETTLILTEEVYNQYVQMRRQHQENEAAREAEEEKATGLTKEAREILRDGENYIRQIRRYNDAIPGEEMSDKLFRLENTMNRILEQVRKNPSSAPELRKLMSYYLPTTVKLLDAYCELDKQTLKGENIVSTKAEIEGALDTINDAFEKLLDSLFQDMAWDISSDISVMETMLKQDGLTAQELRAGTAAKGGQAQTAPAEEPEKGVKMKVGGSTLYFGGQAAQYEEEQE